MLVFGARARSAGVSGGASRRPTAKPPTCIKDKHTPNLKNPNFLEIFYTLTEEFELLDKAFVEMKNSECEIFDLRRIKELR